MPVFLLPWGNAVMTGQQGKREPEGLVIVS